MYERRGPFPARLGPLLMITPKEVLYAVYTAVSAGVSQWMSDS